MYHIELTLENLKVIKLWYHLIQKDREETRADHETITKIKAMAIAAKERNADLRAVSYTHLTLPTIYSV